MPEVQLPPLDAKTPITGAFDPKLFEQAKAGTLPVVVPKAEEEAEARLLAEEKESRQKEDAEDEVKRKKEEEAKKLKEDKKEEVEEEEEEVEKEEEKPTKLKVLGKIDKKIGQQQKALTEEEELAKFNEEGLPFAKKMSRDARQWVLKQLSDKDKTIEESKTKVIPKKEGDLPDSYYLHKEAYVLDPQYQQSVGVVSQAQKELSYWKSQFAKVRNGDKEWEDLMVDAQGNIQAFKRNSDADAETELIGRINHANTLVQQHMGAINYLKTNYQGKVKQAFEGIKKVEDEFFPQFSDEKNLKEHALYEPISSLMASKGMNQLVPSSLFTKLFVHSQDQQAYIEELESELGKNKEEISEVKPPPSSKEHKGGIGKKVAKTGEEKGFNMDEFIKIKRDRGY